MHITSLPIYHTGSNGTISFDTKCNAFFWMFQEEATKTNVTTNQKNKTWNKRDLFLNPFQPSMPHVLFRQFQQLFIESIEYYSLVALNLFAVSYESLKAKFKNKEFRTYISESLWALALQNTTKIPALVELLNSFPNLRVLSIDPKALPRQDYARITLPLQPPNRLKKLPDRLNELLTSEQDPVDLYNDLVDQNHSFQKRFFSGGPTSHKRSTDRPTIISYQEPPNLLEYQLLLQYYFSVWCQQLYDCREQSVKTKNFILLQIFDLSHHNLKQLLETSQTSRTVITFYRHILCSGQVTKELRNQVLIYEDTNHSQNLEKRLELKYRKQIQKRAFLDPVFLFVGVITFKINEYKDMKFLFNGNIDRTFF